jgi:hypothetical protein
VWNRAKNNISEYAMSSFIMDCRPETILFGLHLESLILIQIWVALRTIWKNFFRKAAATPTYHHRVKTAGESSRSSCRAVLHSLREAGQVC